MAAAVRGGKKKIYKHTFIQLFLLVQAGSEGLTTELVQDVVGNEAAAKQVESRLW